MKRRTGAMREMEDDGRTIARMDVEGMPNCRQSRPAAKDAAAEEQTRKTEMLSPRETRQMMLAGMKWALLFSVGFALVLILFVLFCVKVWLV